MGYVCEFIDSFSNTLCFAGYQCMQIQVLNTVYYRTGLFTRTLVHTLKSYDMLEKKPTTSKINNTYYLLFHAILSIFADVTHTSEVLYD